MADLVHLSSSASSEEIIDVLKKDAGVIIDNLLHSDDISRINQDLKPYLKNDVFGRDEFTGFKTKRVGALIARSEACRELALNPLINEVSEKYLSPYCDGYQLHFTSAVSIGPGESKQILHRDRGIWGGYLPRKVEPLMSTIWAVTDFTRENGATQIVPGSHLWEKDRIPNDDEVAYAEMKAGSVLLYTGTVLHGGGENISKDDIVSKLSFLNKWGNKSVEIPNNFEFPIDGPTQIFLVDKPGATQSVIFMGHKSNKYDVDGEYFKSRIMNYPLGGGASARLFLNLREDKGYTYGVY